MPNDQEDLELRFAEVVKEAKTIVEYAEEGAYHFGEKDLQSASDILSLSHYKVSAYNRCKEALLEKLEQKGFTPGKKKA